MLEHHKVILATGGNARLGDVADLEHELAAGGLGGVSFRLERLHLLRQFLGACEQRLLLITLCLGDIATDGLLFGPGLLKVLQCAAAAGVGRRRR